MFQGSHFEKTDLLLLFTKAYSENDRLQLATLGNSNFPFHSDQLTQPYQYPMPYTLGSSYTCFTNPSSFPTYTVSTLQQPSQANSIVQSPPNIPIKDEPIQQNNPIYIKVEVPERKKRSYKRSKAVEISMQSQHCPPQQMSRQEPLCITNKNPEDYVNFDVKNIFVKLVKAFISQQDQEIVKIQLLKQLKKLPQYKSSKFFSLICEKLHKKISDYKKTKEELIKYIIRRTYQHYRVDQGRSFKPELDELFIYHSKNLALYKSMNAYFLKEEFSNEHFLQIYKKYLGSLDQQFQKQNQEKIQKLALILEQVWASNDLRPLIQYKKIPWNSKFQERVKSLAFSLLKEYHTNIVQNDQKVNPDQPNIQANPVPPKLQPDYLQPKVQVNPVCPKLQENPFHPKLQTHPFHPKSQANPFHPKSQPDRPVNRQLPKAPFKLRFELNPLQFRSYVDPDPNT